MAPRGGVGYNRRITSSSSTRALLVATVAVLVMNVTRASAPPAAHAEKPAPERVPVTVSMDLDGDGSSDLATAELHGLRLRFSRGGGLILHVRSRISALAVEDLDRDGDADLVALSSRGRLLVWRNDGKGRFSYQHPRSTGIRAQWSRDRIGNDRGGDPCPATSTTGSSLDACTVQTARLHVFDRAGPITSATTSLHPPSTTRPGSPRSPPLA